MINAAAAKNATSVQNVGIMLIGTRSTGKVLTSKLSARINAPNVMHVGMIAIQFCKLGMKNGYPKKFGLMRVIGISGLMKAKMTMIGQF
jgi:hypothetical protein